MSQKILVNIDLGLNEIQNFLVQSLASDPTPTEARLYYNSTANELRYYDGGAWISLVAAPTDAGTLDGEEGSYYLDRASHTGTQNAATISDLASVVQAYRLDQFAVPTSDVSLNSHKLTNVTNPTGAQDAATKAYVDSVATGLDVKASVRAATTANITLSGEQTIDGVSVVTGNRVLVKAQTDAGDNGIYVAASGAWSRATDADSSAEFTSGLFVFVEEGSTNAGSGWVVTTTGTITVGTTDIEFTQFTGGASYTEGTGIDISGSVISIDAAGGYGVRRFSDDVGDNSSTSFVLTHNFNTRDVQVAVYDKTTPYAMQITEIEHTSVNTVTVRFGVAPTTDQYRVVIMG